MLTAEDIAVVSVQEPKEEKEEVAEDTESSEADESPDADEKPAEDEAAKRALKKQKMTLEMRDNDNFCRTWQS